MLDLCDLILVSPHSILSSYQYININLHKTSPHADKLIKLQHPSSFIKSRTYFFLSTFVPCDGGRRGSQPIKHSARGPHENNRAGLTFSLSQRSRASDFVNTYTSQNLLWSLHPLMIVTYSEVEVRICTVLVEPRQGPQRLPRMK
jgi:hypothetical protein